MKYQTMNTGGAALGTLMFVAFLSLPVIFYLGLEKSLNYVLPWLINLAWICLGLVALILGPLSAFKRLRTFTGTSIYLTSFVFGLLLFVFSLLTTWSLWGGFWAVIGLIGLGGLIVPFALLASSFNSLWLGVGIIFALLILTWGTRLAGLAIADNGERNKP
ncbi:hypothetical protein [Cobetia marina]|uniref:hypothetical protein n=1 Tax=Cobetia marina TaxID=28258 RepID=UPI001142C0BE|nr:hypothetical protein [Cobetia marina]GED43678.1 hypothetical protein HHA02_30070 [Cobetia marina]